MTHTTDLIEKAIATNRFYLDEPEDKAVNYFIYGFEGNERISVMRLIRLAFQAGRKYGDPAVAYKLSLKEEE